MTDKVPYALRRVSLPEHPILYTLDQIAVILNVTPSWLKQRVSFFGRETASSTKMKAINISEPNEKPEWRVSERELKIWLARHGYDITKGS